MFVCFKFIVHTFYADKTMVKLAPQAFLQPSTFLDNIYNYDETAYTSWKSYLTGQTDTSAEIKVRPHTIVKSYYTKLLVQCIARDWRKLS